MKKIVIALLLTLGAFGALRAQSIESEIMSYLRTEGYVPTYDSDGDIQFKKEGCLYYVIIKDSGEGYSYVEVRVPFDASDMSLSDLRSFATELNTSKYLCKCSAYHDETNGNIFQISMEFIANSVSQARYMMGHAMRLMPKWVTAFEIYH